MPSTLLAQETKELNEDNESLNEHSEFNGCVKDEPSPTRDSFVGLSPNKYSPTKTLSNKIKEETRKLIKYPGKALKRSCPSEDSFNEEEVFVNEDFSSFFKEHDILMEL